MKKLLLMFAAVGLAAMVASPAMALALRAGDFTMHLRDSTSLYTPAGLPRLPADTPGPVAGYDADALADGDESRSVVHLDQIVYDDPPPTTPDAGEVTGLVYDLMLDLPGSTVIPGSTAILRFTGGRFTMWVDPTPEDTGAPAGVDILDTMDPRHNGNAPLEWAPDALGPGMDGFDNVNIVAGPGVGAAEDAILWLDLVFIPLNASGHVLTSVYDLSGTGSGSSFDSFMDVIGGVAAPMFDTNGIMITTGPMTGYMTDMTMSFTTRRPPHTEYLTSYANVGNWQLRSEDPILGNIIPEPASMGLLGLGLAGLAALRRRKK
jgi:hypothetical protein